MAIHAVSKLSEGFKGQSQTVLCRDNNLDRIPFTKVGFIKSMYTVRLGGILVVVFRLLFKNVLLRVGISIIIHFRINDLGWC